jgi:hypothetical protein
MSPQDLTVDEAIQRLTDIEKQLAEVVPQLQAEAMFLRGWLTAKQADSQAEVPSDPTVLPDRAARRKTKTA